MSEAPNVLLQAPEQEIPVDALSDVLRVIRLSGGVFLGESHSAALC